MCYSINISFDRKEVITAESITVASYTKNMCMDDIFVKTEPG